MREYLHAGDKAPISSSTGTVQRKAKGDDAGASPVRAHRGNQVQRSPQQAVLMARTGGLQGAGNRQINGMVQQRQDGSGAAEQGKGAVGQDPEQIKRAAKEGIQGGGSKLPYLEKLQKEFGKIDISGIQAHIGGKGAEAAAKMGAEAYASGEHVVFAEQPDLKLVAHEVAHVIQQRGGASPKGGVGEVGDRWEQEAERVAEVVVQGRSAAELLGGEQGGGRGVKADDRAGVIQLKLFSLPNRGSWDVNLWASDHVTVRPPGLIAAPWGEVATSPTPQELATWLGLKGSPLPSSNNSPPPGSSASRPTAIWILPAGTSATRTQARRMAALPGRRTSSRQGSMTSLPGSCMPFVRAQPPRPRPRTRPGGGLARPPMPPTHPCLSRSCKPCSLPGSATCSPLSSRPAWSRWGCSTAQS